jgi:thermolysin
MTVRLKITAAGLCVLAMTTVQRPRVVQGREGQVTRVAAAGRPDLRAWDNQVDAMIRERSLELTLDREDTLLAGRRHRRFMQTVDGVPVYGGDITRQTDASGVTLSIFGTVYEGVAVSTQPRLAVEGATAAIARLTGVELGREKAPELVILPREDGTYALTYMARVATAEDITLYFLDADTGAVVLQRSDAHRQAQATGIGTGVLGDRKKVQAAAQGGVFVGSDKMRPPVIETFDMRGNLARTLQFLNGAAILGASDFASDSDNDWADGANVDAHTYAGLTYDYYFKRFGRRGLDNANIRIRSLTHPVNRNSAGGASNAVLSMFFLNAFYAGDGIMVYGEGLPEGMTFLGLNWNFMAGSLEIVAHELTHGVTDYSSNLIYLNESGALNEAFSDIMGTAIEFFFQQAGSGPGSADYLLGEDVVTPGGLRSMENPGAYGDPDHYSIRFRGAADNGGVHINSGIANQAYYLAVEGGTNRTSGLAVQGVGRANREQMEKVFYRAFTQLMPSNSTFATARAATIQAAIDLYGNNSPALRAVTDAWTAVGVN